MKSISKFPRIILLLLVCFFTNLFSFKAQNSTVPDKINYQAIAHSSNGQTLNNQTIDVLIGIHIQSSSYLPKLELELELELDALATTKSSFLLLLLK